MAIEEKTTYTFNGVEYPTREEAEAAETALKESTFDVNKHIHAPERAKKLFERAFINHKKYPYYIKMEDRYGTDVYIIRNQDDILNLAWKLLKIELEYNLYDEEFKIAKYIIDTQDFYNAYWFFKNLPHVEFHVESFNTI